MGCLQRLVGGHFDVRLDACAFPVGFGDGIDGPAARNPDGEVVIDGLGAAGVRAPRLLNR